MRSILGADKGRDHNLVMMTVKLKLKRMKETKQLRVKYDIKRLHDQAAREFFRAKIGEKFTPLSEMTDVQVVINEFTEAMNGAAVEVLAKAKKKKQ